MLCVHSRLLGWPADLIADGRLLSHNKLTSDGTACVYLDSSHERRADIDSALADMHLEASRCTEPWLSKVQCVAASDRQLTTQGRLHESKTYRHA